MQHRAFEASAPGATAKTDMAAMPGEDAPVMRFSVIVPVYRHWHMVPDLLECLNRQSVGASRFEVLLVDNASPDLALPDNLPPNATVLACDTPGSYAARNLGAAHARGQWLAFTDADCRPAPDWLERLDEAAAAGGDATLLGGGIRIASASDKPSAWEIYDMVKGIPQDRYIRRGYAATANFAVARQAFERLGGFDGRRFSGGDADFCRRAARAGFGLSYAADARVDHLARTTWRQVSDKARRIKGGHLKAGSAARRGVWLLRTITPPVFGIWRFLRSRAHPLRFRIIACLVLMRVWLLELREIVRLGAGNVAERR